MRLLLPATCAYVPTLVLEVWAAGKLVGAASLDGEELVASANIMRLNASVMHPSALGAGLKQRPGQRATPHKITTKALDSGGALIGISTALKDFPEHLTAVAPKHAKPKLKVRVDSTRYVSTGDHSTAFESGDLSTGRPARTPSKLSAT